MQLHRKAVLLAAASWVANAGFAADSPALAGEASQRELLQPPKMAVASPITDRFALRGVFYMPDITSLVRYDNSAGVPGTLVSGEDTLGFPAQRKQGSLDMMFRISERHRIHADFSKVKRSGDQVINQQIRFGDSVYQVNDRVISSMDLRKLGLTYTYSLLRSEKWELGAGLALHLIQLDGRLDVPARFVSETLDGASAFPTLAADVTWRATRRFSVNLAGSYLGVSVDDASGGYLFWHGDIQFRARPNLAFGVGYTQTRYRIENEDPESSGYFRLQYKGPEAFVRVSF